MFTIWILKTSSALDTLHCRLAHGRGEGGVTCCRGRRNFSHYLLRTKQAYVLGF